MNSTLKIAVAAVAVVVAGSACGPVAVAPSSAAALSSAARPTPTPTTAPSTTSSPTAAPTPSPNLLDTSTWPTYVSERYGFSIAHPADWTARPATRAYAAPADAETTATEGFIAPAATVFVSAWSVVVTPGISADAWIQTYCPKITDPCTGIPGRAVAVSMDGHAGLLVRFTGDVEAFILVNNRMYIVAEWRPDNDQADLHYASGTLLVEGFLSTMRLLPGGPAPSATPRPS